MLNRISITDEISLGEFAELLLFYDSVHLLCGESTIRKLVKQAEPSVLIPFLEEHQQNITLEYKFSDVCVSGGLYSDPSLSIMHERQITSEPDFIEHTLNTGSLDCKEGFLEDHALARRLVNLMAYHSVDEKLFHDALGGEYALLDFRAFLSKFAHDDISRIQIPNLFETLQIQSSHSHYSIVADSSVKDILRSNAFSDALSAYAQSISCLDAIDGGGHIRAKNDVSLALSSKLEAVVNRSEFANKDRNDFVKYAFKSARDLQSLIDAGHMTFREFINIYNEGRKFREWIVDLPDNSELLTEYLENINKMPALMRLPSKTVRWSLFTGAGIAADALLGGGGAGTLAGASLGALDTFIVDKLISKWKPNQFIATVDKNILKSSLALDQ